MRESVLKAFVAKRFLPPKEVAHWRVPRQKESPQPQPNEVVSFITFHERGLLNEWGLELQHLNPMGVLHIAGFVTVCEAFLGMEPHVDLFWLFFSGRAMTAGNLAKTALVGGFTLWKKPSMGGTRWNSR